MKCITCGKEIRPCNLKKHEKACTGKVKREYEEKDGKKVCPFCKELYSKLGINAHVWRMHSSEGVKWKQTFFSPDRKKSNQYLKAKELGLPKPEVSEESRRKRSENNKKRTSEWNKENGKKISKTCLAKSAKGEWHTSLAKYMHYSYKGVDLHGKWELAYAQYLDREEINWIRCKDRFAYTFEDKVRFYTPDFFLTDSKQYVEIKGYETEKDKAKWEQFPLSLTVLKFKELKALVSKYSDIDVLVKKY